MRDVETRRGHAAGTNTGTKPARFRVEQRADGKRIPRCALLDNHSEPTAILDQLIGDAVTKLHLVADGGTTNLTHATRSKIERKTHTHKSMAPTGGEWYHDILASYYRCRTHRQRLDVILEAQDVHRRLTVSHAKDPSLKPKSEEWKRRIASDPRSCRVLAAVYDVSPKTVSNYKRAYGPQGV